MYITADIIPSNSALVSLQSDLKQPLVYHTPGFLNFLQNAITGSFRCIAAWENGNLVGLLPYFYLSTDIGSVINSLPWYGSHGGCIVSEMAPHTTRLSLIKAFYSMLQINPDLLTATISLSPFEEPYAAVYAQELRESIIEKRLGQILPLPCIQQNDSIENSLFKLFHQKTRNAVRKACKQGFTYQESDNDEAWDFLYTTHHENMLSIGGLPKLQSHFYAMREYIPKENRILSVTRLEGKIVAAMFCTTYGHCVEYLIPTINAHYRAMQPLSFLIFHAMQRFTQKGFRFWNFGGTWETQLSLYRFKARWGAKDVPYSYFCYSSERGKKMMRNSMEILQKKFPYYYIFPKASWFNE